MKKPLLLLMAVLFSLSAFSQTVVTLCDGTATDRYLPTNPYWKYSIAQMIYISDEVGTGVISSVAFKPDNDKTRTLAIYMAEVDKGSFTSSTDRVPHSEFTLVYDGQFVAVPGQWITMDLSESFVYTGAGNLVIAVVDHTGSFTSAVYYHGETGDVNRSVYSGADGTIPSTCDQIVSPYSSQTNMSAFRPAIQLGIAPLTEDFCYAPKVPTLVEAMEEDLTVEWIAAQNATGYNLQIKLASESWDDIGEIFTTNDTVYTFFGLTANTKYDIRVQSDCESAWKQATFKTACGIAELPLVMNFDDPDDASCLGVVQPYVYQGDGRVFPLVTMAPSIAHGGSNGALEIIVGGNCLWAFPEVGEDITALALDMWVRASMPVGSTIGELQVGYITDMSDATTFVPVQTINHSAASTYERYYIPFSGAEAGSRMAVRYVSNTYSTYSYYFDDVKIDYLPECAMPDMTSVNVSQITDNEATVTWTDSDESHADWRVYFKAAGSEEYEFVDVSGEPSTVIFGLSASTQYSVYVVTLCGTDESDATNVVTFKTACGPVAILPYVEDFEGYVGSGVKAFECWDTPVSNNGPFVYCGHAPSCYSGANSMEFKATSEGQANVVVLPMFEEDIHTLRLSFWATSTHPSTGYVRVGVMTDATDTNTFELVGVCGTPGPRGSGSASGNGNKMGPFDFSGVEAESGRIALIYVRENDGLSSPPSWNLDDFVVDYIPECAEPTGFTATNPAGHSIVLAWTSAQEEVMVAYKKTSDEQWTEGGVISETPFVYTGLDPETSYQFKIGTVCDDGSISYSDVKTFTTDIACPAPTITLGEVTAESASISFNGDADSYTIKIKEQTATDWTEIEVNDLTYTFENLTATTVYNVQVIANCGEEDGNSQPGTLNFMTTMIPVDLPYTTSFGEGEDAGWLLNNGSCVNYWMIGTPANHTNFGNGLFVTTDGVNGGYNVSATTVVTAEKAFNLNNSPLINIEFDMYVNGETAAYDFIKVFFAPADVEFNIGNSATTQSGSSYSTNALPLNGSNYYIATTNGNVNHYTFEAVNPAPNGVGKLVFLWKNDYTAGSATGGAHITNISVVAPECVPPVVTLEDVTTDEATISVTEIEGTYVYRYKQNGSEWTEYIESTEEQIVLSDLNPATAYTFQIAGVCEDESYSNFITINFSTTCGTISQLPYVIDFEQESSILCLTSAATGSYNGRTFPEFQTATSAAHGGTGSMELMGGTSSLIVTAFSPIDEQLSNLRISLWSRCGSSATYAGTVEVGYMTNANDASTFVAIGTIPYISQGTYNKNVFSFAGVEAEGRIAIRYNSNYSTTSWYIDDVVIELIPDCTAPVSNSVTATGVTSESAIISWVDNEESHTSWELHYKEYTAEDWSDVIVNENPYTLTDLLANTKYQVAVSSVCDGGVAEWTDLVTFTTTTIPVDVPFFTDFEDENPMAPFANAATNMSNEWIVGDEVHYGDADGHSLYLSNNGHSFACSPAPATSFSSQYNQAVFMINFPEEQMEYHLSFDYKVGGYSSNEGLLVRILDGSQQVATPAQGTQLLPLTSNVNDWTHFDVILEGVAGTSKKIVFEYKTYYSTGSHNNIPAAIDNISIIGTTCTMPTNVVKQDATENSLSVTWQENGSATQWMVYYKEHSVATFESVDANEIPFTIEGLQSNTAYDVYVVSVCDGGEMSAPSAYATMRTSCGIITELPWTEGFESYTGSGATEALCWDVLASYNADNVTFPAVYRNYKPTSYEGNNSMEFKGGYNIIVLPEFEEDFHNLRVSFYANTTSTFEPGTMEVGIITNLADFTSFESVATFNNPGPRGASDNVNATGSVLMVADLLNAQATTGRIALRYVNANTSVSWNVDNFTVELSPSCLPPATPVVSQIAGNSANVSWTDNNPEHNAWRLYYKNASETEYTEVEVNENSYTLTDLQPASNYQVYVASYCGEDEISDGTPIVSFATPCTTVTSFPYNEGFDSGEFGCWNTEVIAGGFNWEIEAYNTNNGSANAVSFEFNPASMARLSSPVFDLTSLTNPTMSLFYRIDQWDGITDSIAVVYRTSSDNDWTFIKGYGSYTNSVFTADTMALPSPSASYQVAFIGIGRDGNYVYLDDISIFDNEGGSIVNPCTPTTASIDTAVCQNALPFTWNGQNVDAAGIFTYTTTNAAGCDSTVTLNVVVNAILTASIDTAVCQTALPFTWNGQNVDAAGVYTYVTTNAAGCDSTVTLNVTLLEATTEAQDTIVCPTDFPFTWNEQNVDAAGEYTYTTTNEAGCEHVITLTVNVYEQTVAEDVTVTLNNADLPYTHESGLVCDEFATYEINAVDENGCTYSYNLVVLHNEGLFDAEANMSVTLYPNPTSGDATLSIEGLNEDATILVTDVQGRVISTSTLATGEMATTIETSNLPAGVYYVRVLTATTTNTQKLIKK